MRQHEVEQNQRFRKMGECEGVGVEVWVKGSVVGGNGSVVGVEVYWSAVGVFVYSLPRGLWDGVDPSWSFASSFGCAAESSSSPASCEGDVVCEVVIVGS